MDSEDKLELIYRYAKTHSDFCLDFVHAMQEIIDSGCFWTAGQEQAVDNIIYGFRLELTFWEIEQERMAKKVLRQDREIEARVEAELAWLKRDLKK